MTSEQLLSTAAAAVLLLMPAVALAAPDLTWHGPAAGAAAQREQVSFQAMLPSLRCGVAGEPSNSCRLNGTLQVRGPQKLNSLQGYSCVVRYSYMVKEGAGFGLRVQQEGPLLLPEQPPQPGVAASQGKIRQRKNDLEYGSPAPREEPVRMRGTTHLRGSVMLKDGRAEVQLHEGAPIMLPEQVRQVELEELACSAD